MGTAFKNQNSQRKLDNYSEKAFQNCLKSFPSPKIVLDMNGCVNM